MIIYFGSNSAIMRKINYTIVQFHLLFVKSAFYTRLSLIYIYYMLIKIFYSKTNPLTKCPFTIECELLEASLWRQNTSTLLITSSNIGFFCIKSVSFSLEWNYTLLNSIGVTFDKTLQWV